MSLARSCTAAIRLRLSVPRLANPHSWPPTTSLALQRRTYAKRRDDKEPRTKHNPTVATDALVPGSQQKAAGAEYARAEEKMKGAVDRFRKDVAALEVRASGRVTPAVLAPVRVTVPENKGGDGRPHRLEELATVGVREGTTLLVTVFDEHTLKFVESGIYDAKISGVVPQKLDERTLKIPMPKATVDARNTMLTTVQRQAEDVRQQIRKQHSASIKKGNYKKRDPELEEFQELTSQYLAEVDKVLANMKQSAGGK